MLSTAAKTAQARPDAGLGLRGGCSNRRPAGWMRSSICTQKNPPAQAAPKRRVIYQVFWRALVLGCPQTACKSYFSSRLKARSARTPVGGATSEHGAARQGRAGSDRGRPGTPHPRMHVADPPRRGKPWQAGPAPMHARCRQRGRAALRAGSSPAPLVHARASRAAGPSGPAAAPPLSSPHFTRHQLGCSSG